MNLDDFYKLKERVDAVNKRTSQIEGRIKQVKAQAKKEFGCSSAADLKELLDKQTAELKELETRIAKKQRQFERKWRNALNHDG